MSNLDFLIELLNKNSRAGGKSARKGFESNLNKEILKAVLKTTTSVKGRLTKKIAERKAIKANTEVTHATFSAANSGKFIEQYQKELEHKLSKQKQTWLQRK